MQPVTPTVLVRAFGCFFAATFVVGCAGGSGDRFVPETTTARSALEAALNAWQRGEPPGEIQDISPPVQVTDTQRRPNQTLKAFEILGEVGGDPGRCFSVRLALENPSEQRTVRYLVLGDNPLWVFREEDYTMLTHWEHSMPDAAATKGP
jgi:hypothetical protein